MQENVFAGKILVVHLRTLMFVEKWQKEICYSEKAEGILAVVYKKYDRGSIMLC